MGQSERSGSSVGSHHGCVMENLGLGLDVDGHSVGAGHVHDLLNVVRDVTDDVNVLDDLLGDVHVTHDLNLHGGIHVLDDVHVLVDDLGLVHGVGAINIDGLELGHVADLFDLNNLGHVLYDLIGSVNVLSDGDVTDLLADLCLNLGDMTNNLELAFLYDNLGHVADDFLDLGHLNVLDGDGNMDRDGGLDMLDLRHGDWHFAGAGHSPDNGHLYLLLNVLGHMHGAVHDDLTGHVTDLGHLNLDGARDLTVLDDLDGNILVDDLMVWDLHNLLNRDGSGDLMRYLDILHDGLDLYLGDFNNALNGLLNILNLGHLHDALLSHDLGDVHNALLGHNLGLDQGGSMSNGVMSEA